MIDFSDLTEEMRLLTVLVEECLSDLGLEYDFLKGRNIKPVDSITSSADQISTKIKKLIDNDELIMMIYTPDDYRLEILGVKIGKKPLFPHKFPLILAYFDDEINYYAIYINATAKFSEIAFPFAYILDKLGNTEIVDLFDHKWDYTSKWESKWKFKRLKKGHYFYSNDLIYVSERFENLIEIMKSTFGRTSKVSDSFMEGDFCFIISEDKLESSYISDDDKELWDDILEQINKDDKESLDEIFEQTD